MHDSSPNLFIRILKWSERYTKTDMVYIVKGGFWLSIGQVVAVVSSFFLSVILAHALPKEVYGNYKYILSITGIIGGLSLSGIGTTLTQAVARGAEGTLFLAVRTQLKWSGLVGLGCLVVGGYYFLNDNTIVAASMVVAALTVPFANSFGLYGSYLAGKKDFQRSTLYWIVGQLVSVVVLASIAITTQSVFGLIAGYFITSLLSALYFYHRTLKKSPPSETAGDPSMIRYGGHLSIMNFIGTVANQLDKVLVFHYVGAVPLAIYSFAFAIPE